MLEAIILVVFPFCMVFSAVSDTLSMKIANTVPLVLLSAFLLVAPLTGMAMADIGLHLLTGAIVLAVTFVLFAMGGMGGGDAKLLMAASVWMGFGEPVLEYLIVAALCGGLLTMGILVFRGSSLQTMYGDNMFLKNFGGDAKGVPYGIALGAAGLMTYGDSPLAVWALQRIAG